MSPYNDLTEAGSIPLSFNQTTHPHRSATWAPLWIKKGSLSPTWPRSAQSSIMLIIIIRS